MLYAASAFAIALLLSQQSMSQAEIEALTGRLASGPVAPTLTPTPQKPWEAPNSNGYSPRPVSPTPVTSAPAAAPESSGPMLSLTVTPEYEVAARRKVAEELRDPPSAYFRNVVVRSDGRGEVICGTVSGRNGFGGMGQGMPFYITTGMVFVESSPHMQTFVYEQCAAKPIVVRELDWNS